MLLAVDVGNTHTVFGLFESESLRATWRLSTQPSRTEEEWTVELATLFSIQRMARESVDAAVMCSVVPPLTAVIAGMVRRYFGVEPLQVGPGVRTGVRILYENPLEVGADRIVNSVAALARVGAPAIVVDLGTATTFDALSPQGEYLGGIIVPGLQISADALFARAAKLPRVEVRRPPRLIGRNTVHSIQSGLYHGYAALIGGVIERMKREIDGEPRVVATGGLSRALEADLEGVDLVDPDLTLLGLRLVWAKNQSA